MSDALSLIVNELGLGGVGGFIVGFAVKKLSKFVLFLMSLLIGSLVYLSLRGVLSVNYEALFKLVGDFLGAAGSALSWLIHTVALLPLAASFVIGFLIGFKLG
ncbi:hypothetical protein KEJ24_05690 [Candidatus Bathyarchaeota archaeon]|nr:hypothetical protein [Candidatus Bathyarchaeota archaeon]